MAPSRLPINVALSQPAARFLSASSRPLIPFYARSLSCTAGARASAAAAAPRPSLFRRATAFTARGIAFTLLGFVMAAAPAYTALDGLLNPPTHEETLQLYAPTTPEEKEVEDHINGHPVVAALRADAALRESRPHMRIPEPYRPHNLTGGTLLGPGKVVVPPFAWEDGEGRTYTQIFYVGGDMCGHPGIVHGGFLATVLDEGMARCCFAALPHKLGVTANLNINYRNPAIAEGYIVLRANTSKIEGRKAWVNARLETLVGESETPKLLAEAEALFISPRQAATMAKVYPVS